MHPVVGSLLHYKWMTFGAPSFFVNLIFYVVFLALFTSLVILTPLPNGPVCRGNNKCSKLAFNYTLHVCVVDGCWGQWSPWSCCAESCGRNVLTQNRTRHCNDPMPVLGGKPCDGKSIDIQVATCNNTGICSQTTNNTNASRAGNKQ